MTWCSSRNAGSWTIRHASLYTTLLFEQMTSVRTRWPVQRVRIMMIEGNSYERHAAGAETFPSIQNHSITSKQFTV